MKTLVLVAAEKREFAGLEPHLARRESLAWPLDYCCAAVLGGRRVLLVANGQGGRLASEALELVRNRTEIGAVVSTGFCGGLDPALAPGEIFVACQVRGPEAACYPARLPDCARPHVRGVLVSENRIVQTSRDRRRLWEQGGAAVDLESAALAGRAWAWRLPFYAIRAVTDTAEESFRCDFEGARLVDGRLSYRRLLTAALGDPAARFAELWRLRRRANLAAQALGEFLADCRF